MKQPREERAFAGDLEIRGGDGRTIVGLAAPFNSATEIADQYGHYRETIMPGSFRRTIAERGPQKVKLLALHDRQALPVGRATELREDARGLVAEFKVSATQRGDEILELVRDGALDGLSIGFRTIRDRWSSDKSSRWLLEARLDEISLVAFPAYDAARVEAVRAATSPQLLVAQRRLDLLRSNPYV